MVLVGALLAVDRSFAGAADRGVSEGKECITPRQEVFDKGAGSPGCLSSRARYFFGAYSPRRGTLIACLRSGTFEYLAHPARCDFFARVGHDGRRVRDVRTRGLRWSGWGGRRAVASGRDSVGGRLTVRAYRKVQCGHATWYYSVVLIRRPSGQMFRMSLATCGRTHLGPVPHDSI